MQTGDNIAPAGTRSRSACNVAPWRFLSNVAPWRYRGATVRTRTGASRGSGRRRASRVPRFAPLAPVRATAPNASPTVSIRHAPPCPS